MTANARHLVLAALAALATASAAPARAGQGSGQVFVSAQVIRAIELPRAGTRPRPVEASSTGTLFGGEAGALLALTAPDAVRPGTVVTLVPDGEPPSLSIDDAPLRAGAG